MATIEDEEPPPAVLTMAWQCKGWNTLPESGGMMDQDYALMRQMTAALNIYGALSHFRNAIGAQIHSLSTPERRILRSLKDMGLLFNG